MPKTKILHVVNISFVLQHFLGGQIDYFQEKGVKMYIACSPSKFLYSYAKQRKFIPIGTPIHRAVKPIADLKSIYTLIKLLRKERIDIVVGHTPKGGLIAMLAAFVAGTSQRIYFRHGIVYDTSHGFKRFLLKALEKLTAACATKIICVSQGVLNRSEEEKLNNPSKNMLLNKGSCNGIDDIFFSKDELSLEAINTLRMELGIKENDYVVGYVGRLVRDKGINELVEGWKVLLKKETHLKLLLIGPYETRDGLSEEVIQYINKEPSIIHVGLVESAFPYYAIMNTFILPSYREGLSTVILEASAMEIPIITTRATGCIDAIVENHTGTITAIEALDIADKILFYKQHPEIAITHGRNGRKFVEENFDQKIIWKEIEEKVFEM